jgi:hypothetical protein
MSFDSRPAEGERLERGDFVRLCYRLGHSAATGVLTLELDGRKQQARSELLILRRGQVFTRESDALGRETAARMERLASATHRAHFDAGLAAYPPSLGRPFSLVSWARQHLERQIDSARAQELVRELAGARLELCPDKLPDDRHLDATDRRILDAMKRPRRLDQIWPLARTPRFRLLTFVHFLRAVGAVRERGVAAAGRAVPGSASRQREALAALGIAHHASRDEVKRVYRRLARELHPDLNASLSGPSRRRLEQQLAEINSAYRELMQPG